MPGRMYSVPVPGETHLSRLLWTAGILAVSSSVGCTVDTNEALSISYGSGEFAPPVEADILCSNGGCDGLEQVEVQLTYDREAAGFAPSDAFVEILQYRVQYAFRGDDPGAAPPDYAADTVVICTVDETVSFNIRAVGQVQREFVLAHYGTDQIDLRGTLELAGYDYRNASVLVSGDFDISFADFVDTETDLIQ